MTDKERIEELKKEITRRDQAEEKRKVQSYKDELRQLSELASWNHGGTSESRLSHIAYFFLRRSELAKQERNELFNSLRGIDIEPFRKYLTAAAYDLACAAIEGHRGRADAAELERDKLKEMMCWMLDKYFNDPKTIKDSVLRQAKQWYLEEYPNELEGSQPDGRKQL